MIQRAIGNSGNENRKWTMEMENGNGQNLVQMNARVKPLINDHFLKTTSVKRPHTNYVPKMIDDLIQRPPLYKDRIAIRFQRWLRYTVLNGHLLKITKTTSMQRPHGN